MNVGKKVIKEDKQTCLDMLKGNINRIAVTNDIEELIEMCDYAMARIVCLAKIREEEFCSRLKGK